MWVGLRRFSCFLALLAVVGVGGCSVSEPAFESAYSAMGAQVK
jgi:hypothetical protein